MIPVKMLCKKHLCGEHGEIHKHRHNFVKKHSITGRKGQIEPLAMQTRHDELAKVLANHKSPYVLPDLSYYDLTGFTVDVNESIQELTKRCPECRELIAKARLEYDKGL